PEDALLKMPLVLAQRGALRLAEARSEDRREPGMRVERGILVEDPLRKPARTLDERGVLDDAQQPERRPGPGLRAAQHVTLAPQLEVELGEFESVERGRDGVDPLPRRRTLGRFRDEEAEAGHVAASHAPAQLMQLRHAEA